jgi:hypothetical protein
MQKVINPLINQVLLGFTYQNISIEEKVFQSLIKKKMNILIDYQINIYFSARIERNNLLKTRVSNYFFYYHPQWRYA